eukprot:PhF_6_TR40759/c1_g1_i1/m.61407
MVKIFVWISFRRTGVEWYSADGAVPPPLPPTENGSEEQKDTPPPPPPPDVAEVHSLLHLCRTVYNTHNAKSGDTSPATMRDDMKRDLVLSSSVHVVAVDVVCFRRCVGVVMVFTDTIRDVLVGQRGGGDSYLLMLITLIQTSAVGGITPYQDIQSLVNLTTEALPVDEFHGPSSELGLDARQFSESQSGSEKEVRKVVYHSGLIARKQRIETPVSDMGDVRRSHPSLNIRDSSRADGLFDENDKVAYPEMDDGSASESEFEQPVQEMKEMQRASATKYRPPAADFMSVGPTPPPPASMGGLPIASPILHAAAASAAPAPSQPLPTNNKLEEAKLQSQHSQQQATTTTTTEPFKDDSDAAVMQLDQKQSLKSGSTLLGTFFRRSKQKESASMPVAFKKTKKPKKKKSDSIDEVFADLENAMGLMGKAIHSLLKRQSKSSCMGTVMYWMIVIPIVYLIFFALVVTLVLPCFFTLLMVRMFKVEMTVQRFLQRAAVIAGESVAKRTFRLWRLLFRALPMSAFLWIFPFVWFLVAVESRTDVNDVRDYAFGGTTAFLSIVLLMQIQGTVRASVTYAKNERIRRINYEILALRKFDGPAMVIQRAWRRYKARKEAWKSIIQDLTIATGVNLAAVLHGASVSTGSVTFGGIYLPAIPNIPNIRWPTIALPRIHLPDLPDLPEFRLPRMPWVVWNAMRLPSLQWSIGPICQGLTFGDWTFLLSFGFDGFQLWTFSFKLLKPIGWFDLNFLPVVFLQFSMPDVDVPSVQLSVFWICIGLVGLLVTILSMLLLYESTHYNHLQSTFGETSREAADYMFSSFTGSLVYGHGNPKNINKHVCTAVSLLCDTLFFTIVGNVLTVLKCLDTSVTSVGGLQCFEWYHNVRIALCLLAFGYLVPISVLVAPVLAESSQQGKSLRTAKPYMMISNVVKSTLLALAILLTAGRVMPSLIVTLILMLGLVLTTFVWTYTSEPRLAAPMNVPLVNIVRGCMYMGAVFSTCIAIVADQIGAPLNGDYKYAVLLPTIFVTQVCVPAVWYCKTKQ